MSNTFKDELDEGEEKREEDIYNVSKDQPKNIELQDPFLIYFLRFDPVKYRHVFSNGEMNTSNNKN